MRTLILYSSSAGSTKAYAEEIALGMGREAIEFNKKKFRKMNLDDYDTIVYGGWVKGSQIQGIDDFLSGRRPKYPVPLMRLVSGSRRCTSII